MAIPLKQQSPEGGDAHFFGPPAALPPLVSVIIPTFNRAQHVKRAIDSVLSQSYEPVECIVVDDASTDGTAEALDVSYDREIVLVRNPTNRDKSYSRNTGVRASTGDYVCFLDSDDVLTKDSIERRMRMVVDPPRFDSIVFGLVDREVTTSQDRIAGDSLGTCLTLRDYLENPALLHTNGLLAKRDTMLAFGQFDEHLTIREDVELFIRLLCRFEFRFCGTVVARMRAVDRFRARNDYPRIIAQGHAFSAALVADPIVASRIKPFLDNIKRREEAMLLRAQYHSGGGSTFRRNLRQAERAGKIEMTWRWRRRYVASFLSRT